MCAQTSFRPWSAHTSPADSWLSCADIGRVTWGDPCSGVSEAPRGADAGPERRRLGSRESCGPRRLQFPGA
eukprot:2805562-Alexandrium_andersonii.AAC.1